MDPVVSFDRAARLLPQRLASQLLFLPREVKTRTEELRLRCGSGVTLTLDTGQRRIPGSVSRADLEALLMTATESSYHSVQESLRAGFFTAAGGLRVGVCGTAVVAAGGVQGIRSFSSLCIRIPHQTPCVSNDLMARLRDRSVLICAPPGEGKTTFLRELVRRFSEEDKRVALVDERGEIAALLGGIPQFDVGPNTDVLELCPKGSAMELLLRSMSPQVLALDELTQAELPGLRKLAGAGVGLLATAHGSDLTSLQRRGIPVELFQTVVFIRRSGGQRRYETEVLQE